MCNSIVLFLIIFKKNGMGFAGINSPVENTFGYKMFAELIFVGTLFADGGKRRKSRKKLEPATSSVTL